MCVYFFRPIDSSPIPAIGYAHQDVEGVIFFQKKLFFSPMYSYLPHYTLCTFKVKEGGHGTKKRAGLRTLHVKFV